MFENVEEVIEYGNSNTVITHEITCGYCSNNIAPNIGYAIFKKINPSSRKPIGYIYMCPSCKNPIVYNKETKETVPGVAYGKVIKFLPENINLLYDECRKCHANGCYTAVTLIARKLLMHIGVEQGAEENLTFLKYIDFLNDKGFIPPNGKQWVDYIRKIGNESNHEIMIRDQESSKKIITFLAALLLFIYELPNSLES